MTNARWPDGTPRLALKLKRPETIFAPTTTLADDWQSLNKPAKPPDWPLRAQFVLTCAAVAGLVCVLLRWL